jgi:cytosine permease
MQHIGQSWIRLLSIQVGGAICLPVIMIGQILSQTYGLVSAITALLIGNGLLVIAGLYFGKMGLQNGRSSIEQAIDRFGVRGTQLFSVLFTLSMIGWYGIQLNVMTMSVLELMPVPVSPVLLNLALGALMTYVSCIGIKGLETLSNAATPLLIATLVGCLYLHSGIAGIEKGPVFSAGAISLVLAGSIACVIDLPTYFRHAKSVKDSHIAAIILFAVILPLLEGIGVYLGMSNTGSILQVLTSGGGALWTLWVALFLILAGWTTNNTNLYSAGVNSFALMPKTSRGLRTALIGGIGTLIACFDLTLHFETVLNLMGIGIGAMGGVLLVSYILKNSNFKWNYIACGCGTILGICTFNFGAPLLFAFIGSGIITFLGNKLCVPSQLKT